MQCYVTSLMYRVVIQIYIALNFEHFEKKYDFKYVYPNCLHVHNSNTNAKCFSQVAHMWRHGGSFSVLLLVNYVIYQVITT
jgi:hypothetical protein